MIRHALKDMVEDIGKDEKNSHGARAAAAFAMLENVDLMIEAYHEDSDADNGAVLLDVFGLMQGLFVGVDALYDLAIGLTRFKYHINININKTLHELKYIRNDIVGHPTHRTYPDGGVGFSMLDLDVLSKDCLTYKTYVYQKNKLDIKKREVHFKPLLEAYAKEQEKILDDIHAYVTHDEVMTDIPEQVFRLFESLNQKLLVQIKTEFIKTYRLKPTSNHRFLWRAGLLERLILWEERDKELNALILYMSRVQAIKMHEIALDMEKRQARSPYVSLPTLLNGFYRFIRRHEDKALPLIGNLHDGNHPLFESDVEALKAMSTHKSVIKILDWLSAVKDEQKVYLIGSMIRAYRPKTSSGK
ncbi:MAG: hypothetical protein EA375_04685 [Acholeplasmataceae bacterium]|nr:MAG: hypothetical protein EA375_04685 [Acholeplasmataceae bacterium]